jgi:hypothetical protein
MFIAKNPVYMTLALATGRPIPARISLPLHAYAIHSTEQVTGTRVTAVVSSPLPRMRAIFNKNGVNFTGEAPRSVVSALKRCGLVIAYGEALIITKNIGAILNTFPPNIRTVNRRRSITTPRTPFPSPTSVAHR